MVKSKSELVNSKKSNNNKSTPSVKIVNPFDRKVNKVKHEVLNRKVKGVATNIGQSRYNAIEKRKKTLLVEMNQQNKTNQFIDSRYGENDPKMSEEDKMLARFQKEKMRNKNLYNLEDNEETELTHLGQSLGGDNSELIGKDDYQASDDELDEENEFLSERQRFGGGEDNGDQQRDKFKSKKEVYQEIIEKSKQGKAERAREKLLKEGITRELDEEFNLIRGDLVLSSQVKSSPIEDDAFLKFQAESRANEQKESIQSTKKDKHDDFDDLLVQLQGETRARATDRTKTKEELMKEEMERLQQKEKERLERASGDYVEFEQDTEESNRNLPKKLKDKLKQKDNKPKMLSADSLEDENEVLNVNGVDTVFYNPQIDSEEENGSGDDGSEEEEDDDEEEDDEDEEGSENEDEEEEEEDSDQDLEDDEIISGEIEEDQEELELESKKKSNIKQKSNEPVETIPYTFDVPKSIVELDEWLENRNDEEKQTILDRIRVCNHVSIKPQNKEKMKTYLPILYQRFINTASKNDGSLIDWKEIDALSKYIFEISQDVPDISGSTAKELVNSTFKRICKKLEIQSKLNYWPNQSELLLIKLLSNVFPTSDFQHPVLTPAVESLNFYISHCPIKNINDIASSLFTSNLLFFYLSSSKRYSPEITSLLISLLSTFINHNQNNNNNNNNKSTKNKEDLKKNQWASINSNILVPTILLPENYLKLSTTSKTSSINSIIPKKFEFSILSNLNIDFTNSLKINLLNYLISFIEKYIKFYSESQYSESLPGLFNIILSIINKLDVKLYHKDLAEKIQSLKDTIQKVNNEIISSRKPLILLTGKPQQLRQFNPRFNQNSFFIGKDPDAQRAEAKKKKALIKKETKGAIREITKDNQFIQAEKFKKAQLERVENDKKRKHIMSELQKEQQEGKAYKKMKDRLDGRI